jgi:hypothetical protein
MPQMEPQRVPSTSCTMSASSADQNETPAAVAPWSTIPVAPLTTPATIAINSRVRRRDTNCSEASCQRRSPPATEARPGIQTASRKKMPPIAAAIATYWTPRATAKANSVTLPTLPRCASSSETVAPAALGLPNENTSPPETGCPSAEITR